MTDTPQGQPGPLDDLFNFLDDDGFSVPLKSREHPEGKPYRIESPDAQVGLRLAALSEIAAKVAKGIEVRPEDVAKLKLDDDEEREFAQQVLGDSYAEMIADGVSWVRIQRVMQYAYIYFTQGAQSAGDAARAGVLNGGKVLPPNREARRHPQTQGTPQDRQASTATSRKRRR